MEVALQLSADRCERGYELNTRTLNNSRSTYSAHFGQRGSLKGEGVRREGGLCRECSGRKWNLI